MNYRPRVLFVCEHDSGAARMCAAYLEHLAGDRYETVAAALEPADRFPPEAGRALTEEGVTYHDGPGLAMTTDLAEIVDRIITLGFTLNPEVARDVPREEWGIPGLAGRQVLLVPADVFSFSLSAENGRSYSVRGKG